MMRVCTKCREEHPVEFFNKDRTQPDGLYRWCKTCSRAACKRVYRKYHDRHVEMKRAWKAANPERHSQINKAYREADPDKYREKCREHTSRWRAAHPEKAREWAAENPEKVKEITRKWKAANREKILVTERLYIENNRGSVRAKNARRRAYKSQATPSWVDHELMAFIYSECPPGWHVDHIYPLKGRNSCGLHVLNNLQYLPAPINSSKSNKAPVVQEAW